jgi:hypothetical protein
MTEMLFFIFFSAWEWGGTNASYATVYRVVYKSILCLASLYLSQSEPTLNTGIQLEYWASSILHKLQIRLVAIFIRCIS